MEAHMDGRRYQIVNFADAKIFSDGFAYDVGEFILPFRGQYNKNEIDLEPGIYILQNGTVFAIEPNPENQNDVIKYSKGHVAILDCPDLIMNIISKDSSLIKKRDLEIINCDGEDGFKPSINNNDNMLSRIVKEIFHQKNVPLDAYNPRFESPVEKNNKKKALLSNGKMSWDGFMGWCNILDIRGKIIIENEPDCEYPLQEPIVKDF